MVAADGATPGVTDSITRCPNCETTFRVTSSQLSVADGKVRCGTCLRVFNASDHMLLENYDDEASIETPDLPREPFAHPMSDSTAPPGSAVAGDRGAGEEPSAEQEPSADQEPSANEEPSADEEPSAHEEPPETEHRLADLPAEPETPAVDADAALAQEESPDAAPAVPVSRLNASVRMPVREATSADRSLAADPFSSQLFADAGEGDGWDSQDRSLWDALAAEDALWEDGDDADVDGTPSAVDATSEPTSALEDEIEPRGALEDALSAEDELWDADALREVTDDEPQADPVAPPVWQRSTWRGLTPVEDATRRQPSPPGFAEPLGLEPDQRGPATAQVPAGVEESTADPVDAALEAEDRLWEDIAEEGAAAPDDGSGPSGEGEPEQPAPAAGPPEGDDTGHLVESPIAPSDIESLHEIETEVDIPEPGAVPAGRNRAWTFAAALLLLTLAGVHGGFHFERYAEDPRFRPWIDEVCSHVGCQLTAPVEHNALSTHSLIVRSHPELSGALRVDAILRNAGSARQTFPALELRFTDIGGGSVAWRRFVPREYLHGEMRGLRFVPAATEVRLAFEIVDPGERAVGYSLSVLR